MRCKQRTLWTTDQQTPRWKDEGLFLSLFYLFTNWSTEANCLFLRLLFSGIEISTIRQSCSRANYHHRRLYVIRYGWRYRIWYAYMSIPKRAIFRHWPLSYWLYRFWSLTGETVSINRKRVKERRIYSPRIKFTKAVRPYIPALPKSRWILVNFIARGYQS